MTERQKLIAHKKNVLYTKARLQQMTGIEVIKIFEQTEPEELNKIYSAYTSFAYFYDYEPYSRLPYDSSKFEIYSWIISVMGLKEGAEYFFRCDLWVQIRIQNLQLAVQSLWYENNFLLVETDFSRVLEASFDSRDEDNYLIDIWELFYLHNLIKPKPPKLVGFGGF